MIINAGAGNPHVEDRSRELTELFLAGGIHADVRLARTGDEIDTFVREAVAEHPRMLIAAGGDGTISTAAAALAGTDITLGVLPFGTLNHFAKDLHIPLELEASVQNIVENNVIAVDVAEVNGRVFINNSSLGLYPDIVRDRERQQKRLGRGKWPALLWASLAALRRYSFLTVTLQVDGKEALRRTPFVFIGNNEYLMEGFAIGERAGLTDGRLSLYVAQRPGRWRLVLLALRALFGRLRQARDFDAMLATEIVIRNRRPQLRVATDGEVTAMAPPLNYRVRAASLLVMLPGESAAPPAS